MPRVRFTRDKDTGRFIAKAGPAPTIASRQEDIEFTVRRDKRTGQFVKKGGKPTRVLRHPRTGKFITKDTAKLISKRVITQADVDKIIQLSPNLLKAIRRAKPAKRDAARAAIRRNLITHLEAKGRTVEE